MPAGFCVHSFSARQVRRHPLALRAREPVFRPREWENISSRSSRGNEAQIKIGNRKSEINQSLLTSAAAKVAQSSRLRVAAASRRQQPHPTRRRVNPQARTPALPTLPGSWPRCTISIRGSSSSGLATRRRRLDESDAMKPLSKNGLAGSL
jgi:hypothetical protein